MNLSEIRDSVKKIRETGRAELYAHAQMIYDMGAQQTARLLAGLQILIFVGVWKTTFEYFGVPVILALPAGAVVYFGGNFVIGIYYYLSGMYRKVIDVSNQNNEQWQGFLKEFRKMLDGFVEMKSSNEQMIEDIRVLKETQQKILEELKL